LSRLGVLVVCGLLLAGAFAGCSTTQEKAAKQQARSKRILEAREKRQQRRSKSHDHGSSQR
jgi:Na+-transporting NADH:ubiquinone oxidoreductase subunit NqrC